MYVISFQEKIISKNKTNFTIKFLRITCNQEKPTVEKVISYYLFNALHLISSIKITISALS